MLQVKVFLQLQLTKVMYTVYYSLCGNIWPVCRTKLLNVWFNLQEKTPSPVATFSDVTEERKMQHKYSLFTVYSLDYFTIQHMAVFCLFVCFVRHSPSYGTKFGCDQTFYGSVQSGQLGLKTVN